MKPTAYLETTTMRQDPIVAETRRRREEYAARFNYDINAICRAARKKQKESGREVVSLPPKPAAAPATADSPAA